MKLTRSEKKAVLNQFDNKQYFVKDDEDDFKFVVELEKKLVSHRRKQNEKEI